MSDAYILSLVEKRFGKKNLPIKVELWNGLTLDLGLPSKVKVAFRTPSALSHLVYPTLGKLARCYVEEQIDLEGDARDILALGEVFCNANTEVLRPKKKLLSWFTPSRNLLSWFTHNKNFDKKVISYHYDVSNDFYALWLDHNRVYSCAYFRKPDDSLDSAQQHKLEHICRKLNLQEGERFLDIGCGWGGLILWAATHYRTHSVGITLSKNQYEYIKNQIHERGLSQWCEVHLCDYRDIAEFPKFDKIASVGMFEHVGRKNLCLYFNRIYNLLRPGGLLLNHGITAAGKFTQGLGSDIGEFINRYVFPGGELVQVSQVLAEMAAAQMEPLDVESLRPHYAKTLWHWVSRLEANYEEAKHLVGEKKFRVWRIYMAGSAHAFERGWMSVYQILCAKPLENGAVSYPLTRNHVYR